MNSVWIIPIQKRTSRNRTSENSAPNDSGCDVSTDDSHLPETFSTALAESPAAKHSTTRRPPSCYPRHTNLDSLMRPPTLAERLNLARLHYVTITNIFRLACVLFCTFWFVFVATLTVKDYLNHDTIVYLNYKTPATSKPPAISICTHNILSGFSAKTLKNLSAWSVLTEDDAVKKPQTPINIKIECVIFPNTKMLDPEKHWYKCEDLVPVLISMQEGHRCFTYFSDIYGQTTRNLKRKPQIELSFDRNPIIQLYVEGFFVFGVAVSQKVLSENRSHNEPFTLYSGVYLALHDSTILPDMLGLGFHQLKPFHISSFPFNKRVQILIEPPYNPCHQYSTLKNNYSTAKVTSARMYRTRGECFLHCQWKMLNNNRCANYYSIFTKEMVEKENSLKMAKNLLDLVKSSQVLLNSSVEFNIESSIKMCPWEEHSYYDYAHTKQKCLKECPLPCTEVTFDETHMIDYESTDPRSISVISWAPAPVLQIENKRKWDGFVDFVGTLGGQLHVWLGFSIITAISWFFAAIKLHASSYF